MESTCRKKANIYKSKKDAQEAHEAIRPTNVGYVPDEVRKYLSDEQYRLYKLIWERAVTSQMTAAVFDQTTWRLRLRLRLRMTSGRRAAS